MSNPVQAGQPMALSAGTFNTISSAAERIKRQSLGDGSRQARSDTLRANCVWVRNDTGSTLEAGMVASIEYGPLPTKDTLPGEYLFSGCTPSDTAKFAVLMEPLASGTIGQAAVCGVVLAKITWADENAVTDYVGVKAGEHRLWTPDPQAQEPPKVLARVLWYKDPPSQSLETDALVRLLEPGAAHTLLGITHTDTEPHEGELGACAMIIGMWSAATGTVRWTYFAPPSDVTGNLLSTEDDGGNRPRPKWIAPPTGQSICTYADGAVTWTAAGDAGQLFYIDADGHMAWLAAGAANSALVVDNNSAMTWIQPAAGKFIGADQNGVIGSYYPLMI